MAAVVAPQLVARIASPARLAPPPVRPGYVERARLLAQLDAAAAQPLTVVHAPTGYGKTMLLARWAQSPTVACAWATLSAVERTPSRLWPFVAAALSTAVDDLELVFRLERVAEFRSSAAQLRALVEAATSLDDDLALVLDDVQLGGPAVERALARLLERLPPKLHLIVATRRLPELGLGVRRARGELVELTEDDLRLDAADAEPLFDTLLIDTLPTDTLPKRELAALVDRLEGWPAGLHLAALAGAASERPLEVLRTFPNGSRLVADYLRQELLEAQPSDAHRDFLLRTSVLHRLTPASVEALLGSRAAGALLDDVAAAGGFLVPAGDGAHRCRRPVREFLQRELQRTAAASVPVLRRRAASACERSGLVDEAIEQAHASGDARAAAAIARRHALELARTGRIGMLEHVVRRPSVVVELHAVETASSPAELLAAAERLARTAGEVPVGQVRTLLREAAAAERAYALLLLGRGEEARDAANIVELAPPSAARAQRAAVGSLAATQLGMHVAAAPLARAALSACEAARVPDGRACALAHAAAGVAARSHESLARAAALGEPAVRALVLAVLAALSADIDPAEARTQLDAARRAAAEVGAAPLLASLVADAEHLLEPHERPAAEELSPAELRVLRLLASRLTQREIARELYLSPNTIKTHARVIYRKLGVDGRETAVSAARELNLV